MTSFIDGYLRSPLSGIAPWVLMSLLATPGHFEIAVCTALGLALATMWLGSRRGMAVHALDVFGAVFFAALAVVGVFAPPETITWLTNWAGQLTNASLALFVLVTILIRRPFTLPYAKEQAPPEYWDSPLFSKVNYVISGVWAAAFTFSAAVGAYGAGVLGDPDNFWTGWVLQLGAIFFAVAFTEFYPDYAGAKDAASRGENEPAPPLAKLFDWLPTFVLIAGIFGWVTDALPDAAGIGMIVVGVLGNVAVNKLVPAKPKN
ncbi:hypothetical protein [Mycolicibacterium brumae]|uniref:Uncharacterized protein n=1 Tax=Mycolicibacterium brumae TaxID=85968 RepID=A0A2G5PDF6_9MYCO|nr:hypothetical protein [Mycolicibacterium brumae]MCV7191746.1 hypothetical protein [Mycolicibacterium brumae]PIB76365.1 hypothetical protein CQY22_006550 [Mycolicibacterium brumae]RWA15880.1 hypothetical protein MBRU_10035 [Mycolicibacterium brumae DSM 44177]UWW07051.1 hypothetical protein L2Z93_000038 [Mycolicibacterium brumae]